MHIVIIGNGITGVTAARHIRKNSHHEITIISAETDHHFSRTALMYIYMGHMTYAHTKPYEDWFWQKNRINLKRGFVSSIDAENKQLHFESGEIMSYDKLLLAVGSKSNKFGWPGQDLPGVQGLYSYQDVELLEQNTQNIQHAVIVGGGLIGIELAEMLLSRKIGVTFLVRESSFWDIVLPPEESDMINRHIREHHVDLRLETELKEIKSGENGRVVSVVTNNQETIECQLVGLTVGVSPNISFLKGGPVETDRGILVNEYLETNVPDVYAAGDCAQFRTPLENRRPVEQVWYTGRMQGEVVAQSILGQKTAYKPGVWFNSAKFFDIEYQTYGWVWAKQKENEASLYWQHQDGKKAVRIVFDKDSKSVLGFNAMGVRLRHEICEKWIGAGTSVTDVVKNMRKANFDPEFYDGFEHELADIHNQAFPDEPVSVKKHGGILSLFGIGA